MKFLKKLFGKQESDQPNAKEESPINGQYVRITLNEKIMPVDRGFVYEDPYDKILKRLEIGEVTGGGTLQLETGEIKYCDIEVYINSDIIDSITIGLLKDNIEELGAPKGSKMTIEKTGEEIGLGKLEGIGIFLDGKNLSPKVYEENDINFVVEELRKLLGDDAEIIRFWEGNEETALYFYGTSFIEMKAKVIEFLNNHALCQNSRIEQVA